VSELSDIIVGVDGSTEAQRALEWALREAAVRGARVRAVHAYEIPVAYTGYHAGGVMISPELTERAQEEAEQLLEKVIAAVEVPEGVHVQREVVADLQPAQALIAQSKDADMLVVGSRGRGGFTGLLLGSVSQQCVHHATCPVVVVPPEAG
jgi:nucleotide-binding universal stress UspA family protein